MLNIETIDRTIFEAIRLGVVASGYLPDLRSFTGSNSEKSAAFTSAREAIINSSKKGAIDVFGVGSGDSRGKKSFNRITIDRASISIGEISSVNTTTHIKQDDGTFTKVAYPDSTSNVLYEIRYFTESTRIERVIYNILYRVLGAKKHLFALTNNSGEYKLDGESMLIERVGAVSINATDSIEWLLTFQVTDVFLDELEVVAENIPELVTVITEICENDGTFKELTLANEKNEE